MHELISRRPQDASSTTRDAETGGVVSAGDDVAPHEGIAREDKSDDVSQATYTARTYPLAVSSSHKAKDPVVDSSEDKREPEEAPSTARDTSLAGAGTLIGAGAVGAGALAAQEDKHNADDVEKATYTDRSYPVGTSSGSQEPENLDSASKLGPHVPGEFPTDTGEDPHVPGGFPATSAAEKDESGVGTDAAVTSPMGLTAGGATAGAAVADSKSGDGSKATEKDLHPGGSGFPHESSQGADSHAGRDAGIAAGTVGAVGAAGAVSYAATHDSKPDMPWQEPPRDVGREHARNLSIQGK